MFLNKKLMVLAISVMGGTLVNTHVLADELLEVKGGTVQFNGSIVNAPCAVDTDSESQTVVLGQYRVDSLSATGVTSSPVNFAINLIDCAIDTYSKASVTFNGITVQGNNNALAPVATQAADTTAEGVGIQILQDSKVLMVDGSESSSPKVFSEIGGRLNFQAQYIALADEIRPGSANASADFTVTYQ